MVHLLSSQDSSAQKNMPLSEDQDLPLIPIKLRKTWFSRQDSIIFWLAAMPPKMVCILIRTRALASTHCLIPYLKSLLRSLDMYAQLNRIEWTCWCCLTNLSPSSAPQENARSRFHYKETHLIQSDSSRNQTQATVGQEVNFFTRHLLRLAQETR